jgi:hypothetical protein
MVYIVAAGIRFFFLIRGGRRRTGGVVASCGDPESVGSAALIRDVKYGFGGNARRIPLQTKTMPRPGCKISMVELACDFCGS